MTRFASSVTVIHRRDQLRAGKILQTRAADNPKMNFIWNSVVKEIQGEAAVTGVVLENVLTGEQSVFPTDGVFVFIGHTPNTEMFRNKVDMDEHGYIFANSKMETSRPGIFAAGEVMDSTFKQVVVSAGMGAAAAIQATRFLEENE